MQWYWTSRLARTERCNPQQSVDRRQPLKVEPACYRHAKVRRAERRCRSRAESGRLCAFVAYGVTESNLRSTLRYSWTTDSGIGNAGARAMSQTITLVVTDTTAGLRRDTHQLTRALDALGVDYTVVGSSYKWAKYFRRGFPLIDLAESLSLRLALRRSRSAAVGPILCATSTSAIMLPSRVLARAGVRFDALTVQNRPGRRNSITRSLERRWLREVKAAFPYTESGEQLCRTISGRTDLTVIRFEPYIFGAEDHYDGTRQGVLTYSGDPDKKGLDLAVQAFSLSGIDGHELLVTGLSERQARDFLATRAIAVPETVRFLGEIPAAEYRALSRRSRIYLGSSRVDEFATTQFEALSDGALLVTCPSAGGHAPYEIARTLGPELVADKLSAESLAAALSRAAQYDDHKLAAYQASARDAVAHLSERRFVEQLAAEVLPALRLP